MLANQCLIDPRTDVLLKAFGIDPNRFFAAPSTVQQGRFTFSDNAGQLATVPLNGQVALGMDTPVQLGALTGIGNYYLFARATRVILTASPAPDQVPSDDDLYCALLNGFAQVPSVGGVREQIHPFGGGAVVRGNYRNLTATAGGTTDRNIDMGWWVPRGGVVIDNERPVILGRGDDVSNAVAITALWQVEGVAIAKSLMPNDPNIPELTAWCACNYPNFDKGPKGTTVAAPTRF